jgi:hypothetical protein
LSREAINVVPAWIGRKVTQTADEVIAALGIGMHIGVELKGMTVKVSGRTPVEGLSPEKEMVRGPHCSTSLSENWKDELERTTCGPKAKAANRTMIISMADKIREGLVPVPIAKHECWEVKLK